MKNIEELRVKLCDAFEMLERDPKREGQVSELANAAGKIISTIAIEMKYDDMCGKASNIPFMDGVKLLPRMKAKK